MEPLLIKLEKMGCDVPGGLRRFANNETMYLKYLYRFPDESTFEKFNEAMGRKDYECAGNEIHTFKGVAGNLGFTDLYDISQKIMWHLKKQEYSKASVCADCLRNKHAQLVKIIRD